jgi:hypothetical protein
MDLFLFKKNCSFDISLSYELHIFTQLYYYFNELFTPIINIKNNEKLGIINFDYQNNYDIHYVNIHLIDFRLCIYKNKLYQPIIRWFYNENRLNVFTKLDILFYEYYNILQKLKILINKYPDNFKYIYYKFININNLLLDKINILINSYYKDNIIMISINNYIKYLNIL